jgi:hypothetical protein
MAADMKASGFSEGLIISNDRFIAGNMHLQFPTSAAIVPNFRFEDLAETKGFTPAVLVWKGDYFLKAPKALVSFMKEKYNIDVTHYPVSFYRNTYKYGRGEKVTLAALYLRLPQTSIQN